MDKYIVRESGPLRGEVSVSGAKNAVLPIMAATLLSDEECVINDAPELLDVDIMCKLLESLGAEIERDLDGSIIRVRAENIGTTKAPSEYVKQMRASIVVMGPLLAREKQVEIPLPGGCAIGDRPVELHFKGLRALGAEIEVDENGVVSARAESLKGADIYLDFPSVGATENIMMAACLAEGVTILENAAQEPEIVDLANFLNKMGARIKGAGTDTIKIEGVERLHGCQHNVIPDRIEAGTFMLAAAITRGSDAINNVEPDHEKPVIAKLKECGVDIFMTEAGSMIVKADEKPLTSTDIKTLPYPGFPTDLQSPFMALLTTVQGNSAVIETVFENRYMHVKELQKMGAKIKTHDRSATIQGIKKLKGAKVTATDLRAGAAMVLAGLVAEGETEIAEVYHIERGYEHFVEKVRGLGGDIRKVAE
ncbi:MAG: UDP-N-acetylglucosamine 1-carboxyvinyltransferase [Anaerovoracaceae bacterium]|nr:UDP-N-acetylglucosamine 1-carboxyvinyltransferase [Anaerovoracaceae bacterium]